MTMHYAKTSAEVAEAEFLKYKNVTARGIESQLSPRDSYELMQLEQRADRILPNGYCLLSPIQTCGKGNACLTCDMFVTDGTHKPALEAQLAETVSLVGVRLPLLVARHGAEAATTNVWFQDRAREIGALERIVTAVSDEPNGGPSRTGITNGAVRGAGTLNGSSRE